MMRMTKMMATTSRPPAPADTTMMRGKSVESSSEGVGGGVEEGSKERSSVGRK